MIKIPWTCPTAGWKRGDVIAPLGRNQRIVTLVPGDYVWSKSGHHRAVVIHDPEPPESTKQYDMSGTRSPGWVYVRWEDPDYKCPTFIFVDDMELVPPLVQLAEEAL